MDVVLPALPHDHPSLALLADCDRATLQTTAAYLRSVAYDVDEAVDGREALAKAISRHPHVIVTETRLPGIDGFRLCELLRSDSSTHAIPIVVVIGEPCSTDRLRALRAGADAVLAKPCLPEQLLVEMERCRVKSRELQKRAGAVRSQAEEQLSRSAPWLEKLDRIRGPMPLSRAFNRHNTTAPPVEPPALLCPGCDRPLLYQYSHIGGVSERYSEQWDYYECTAGCGPFQYRQRTRKLRRLTP